MSHMIKIWNRSVQLSRIFKQYTVNSDKNTIYFYLILIFNFYFFPQILTSTIHPFSFLQLQLFRLYLSRSRSIQTGGGRGGGIKTSLES